MKLIQSLFAVFLACTCAAAAAQWQWIDGNGRRVMSDRSPPPDTPEKNILKRPAGRASAAPAPAAATDAPPNATVPGTGTAPVPPSASKDAGVDKELEAKKKAALDAEAAKLREEEEKITKAKIENCARAKQAKATFDSGVRVSRTNAAGEREVMDDAAREAEIKRIQGIMASDCK